MSRMTPPTGNMRVRPTFRFPLTPPAIYLVDQTFSAAAERRTAPSSNHLLVAFLARDSPAYAVLRDHDVELPPLTIDYMDMDALEPPEVLQTIWGTADSLAEQGEAYITPLHLLAGLLRYHTGSQAVSLLQRHGYDPSWLRNRLIAYLTTRPSHEPLSISTELTALSRSGDHRARSRPMVEEQVAEPVSRGASSSHPRWASAASEEPVDERRTWPDPGRRDGWLDPGHPLNAPNPYLPPGTQGPHTPPVAPSPNYPPSGNHPDTTPSGSTLRPPPPPRPSSDSTLRPVQGIAPTARTMRPPLHPPPSPPSFRDPSITSRRMGRSAGVPGHTNMRPPNAKPGSAHRRGHGTADGRQQRVVPPLQRPTRRTSSRNALPRQPRKGKNLVERLQGRFGSRKAHTKSPKPKSPSMDDLAKSLFGDGSTIDALLQQAAQGAVPADSKAHPRRRRRRRDENPPTAAATPEPAPPPQQAEAPKASAEPPPSEAPPKRRQPRDERSVNRITRVPLTPEQVQQLEAHYTLNSETYPFLAELGRNLSLAAVRGDIDDLVGRELEISRVIDTLNKRRSNNPLLIGPAGVGKTAIVEGLALSLVNPEPNGSERIIIELQMGRLLSGTHLRGSFSERLIRIKDEVQQAEGRIVIFLDELHTWMGAGGSGDGADASGELKAALARGQFPCIGATTEEEYKRYIEVDNAFDRRFQKIRVQEPSREEAIEVIRGILSHYSRHHDVAYDDDAIEAAVHLAQRYIPEQRLPDKAINLVDLGGSRARRKGLDRVDREVVAEVVSDQTGVPVDKLLMRDRERFLRMEEIIGASLIGHQGVIRRLSEVIRRNYAGFHSGRPIGSFLFLGPTGVGKTELVKVLADFLFRDRSAIVRLDMSEFTESHTISRMIGAPPGYVGYDQGGQLTEAVRRRPYQIILFDEIEKAHPEVLNILLQLLDDGRLTDGRNRTVDFSNTVVIMTSNLGAEHFASRLAEVTHPRIGFGHDAIHNGAYLNANPALTADMIDTVLTAAKKALTSELWNRINERLVFGPLSRYEVARIARLQFNDSARRLAVDRNILIEADDTVFEYLIDHGGYDPELGARPMRTTLQRLVETTVADMILRQEVVEGQRVRVGCTEGQLVFQVVDAD